MVYTKKIKTYKVSSGLLAPGTTGTLIKLIHECVSSKIGNEIKSIRNVSSKSTDLKNAFSNFYSFKIY